ncbi:MAG TPA: CopG family transcriptional regulator [Dehalococcoidia bacterium]|nr:CopG family transcriptional regulator [Dehalococcoidia bacterium]
MSRRTVTKITISLPIPLLEVADRLAREQSTSRSGVIAQLLKKDEEERIQTLMEEGYREMAEESHQLAEQAFAAISELVGRATRWDDPAHG